MPIDWSKTWKKYKGQWVAFAADEKTVVGAGKSAKQALSEAEKKGFRKPILARMPAELKSFVGSV